MVWYPPLLWGTSHEPTVMCGLPLTGLHLSVLISDAKHIRWIWQYFFGKHQFVLQVLKNMNFWEWFKIRLFALCFRSWLVCSHLYLWRQRCRCQWWTDGRAKDSSYGLEHEDGYTMQDYASLGFFGLSMVFVSVWFSRGYHALLSLLLNEGFEDIADMQGTSMANIRHSKRLDCQFHPG